MKPQTPYRFAIMCNGPQLSRWQWESVRLLWESGYAEPVLLIQNAAAEEAPKTGWAKWRAYPYRHLLYRLAKRYLFRYPASDFEPMPDALQKLPVLKCVTIRKGKYSEYFSPADLEEMAGYQLDFVLRYGFNIIRGEVLDVPRYGVWSYHHGDEMIFRGGPVGLWEIYRNSLQNGVVLQRLNNLIDAGVILSRRSYRTVTHSYSEHVEKILTHNADMPLEVCKKIASGDERMFRAAHSGTEAGVNRVPGNGRMFLFLLKLLRNRVAFHYRRFFKQEHWLTGAGTDVQAAQPDPVWLPLSPAHGYAADPFCFTRNGKRYVVYEAYDYRVARGRIDLAVLDENLRVTRTKTLLDRSTHLAYPYVFEHGNELYLLPETADENNVQLYRWNAGAETFDFVQVLADIPAVDASLLFHAGKYWLFCGLKNDLPNEKLHIYYADSLTGEYRPHLLNPVKTTPAGSRMGGTFFQKDGHLLRPAQYSVKWYGEKTVFGQLQHLSETRFDETPAGELVPGATWPYREGVHTFSRCDTFYVLDAKRRRSGLAAFRSQFRHS